MISLADFQPLSIAKSTLFIINTGFTDRYIIVPKFMPVLRGPLYEPRFVDTLRSGASFRRLTSLIELKYLHQPSNFVLNILTLAGNV